MFDYDLLNRDINGNVIEWRPVMYFPDYEISTEGWIRNINSSRVMRTDEDQYGYSWLKLRSNRRYCNEYVHILMGETYLDYDRSDRDSIVYHQNFNKCDNRLHNLTVGSYLDYKHHLENNGYTYNGRLPVTIINLLEPDLVLSFSTMTECADFLGVDKCSVSRCARGISRSCKGWLVTIDD